MKKSLSVIGMFAVAAISLTGCSGGSTDAAVTAACPEGVVTLTVLGQENNYPDKQMLDEYTQENECVKFKLTSVPFGQIAQKISVLGASSNPPDIITIDDPDTQSYASQGLLLPLDKYLPKTWKEDVGEAQAKELSWSGKVYAPGFNQDVLSLWYNKDMTDKAGIVVPDTLESAWTWDQAFDAFKKCQAANPGVLGLEPSRMGDGTPGFEYASLIFLRTEGNPKASKDSSSYKTFYSMSADGDQAEGWLNTPEAVKGAEFYQSLFSGADPVTLKTGLPNALLDKKACFNIDTTGSAAVVASPEKRGFTLGISPIPYAKTPIVHSGSGSMAVTARSKYPEQAAKALVALSSGDMLLKFCERKNLIPVLKSVAAQMSNLKEMPLKLAVEQLQEWGQPRPPSPHHTEFSLYVTDAMRNIAYGSDPKAQLDSAAKQIQATLGR